MSRVETVNNRYSKTHLITDERRFPGVKFSISTVFPIYIIVRFTKSSKDLVPTTIFLQPRKSYMDSRISIDYQDLSVGLGTTRESLTDTYKEPL